MDSKVVIRGDKNIPGSQCLCKHSIISVELCSTKLCSIHNWINGLIHCPFVVAESAPWIKEIWIRKHILNLNNYPFQKIKLPFRFLYSQIL